MPRRRQPGPLTRLLAWGLAVFSPAALTLLPPAVPAAASRAAAAAAPPLQTFPAAEAGLIGCRGQVWPRSPGPAPAAAAGLLAAWSLEQGWGVMRIDGRLQRFPLAPARRLPESGSAAGGARRLWSLSWQVGRYRAELRFPSERLRAGRWGGDGLLRLSSLATGDSYALPVRVEEGC